MGGRLNCAASRLRRPVGFTSSFVSSWLLLIASMRRIITLLYIDLDCLVLFTADVNSLLTCGSTGGERNWLGGAPSCQ